MSGFIVFLAVLLALRVSKAIDGHRKGNRLWKRYCNIQKARYSTMIALGREAGLPGTEPAGEKLNWEQHAYWEKQSKSWIGTTDKDTVREASEDLKDWGKRLAEWKVKNLLAEGAKILGEENECSDDKPEQSRSG